MINKTISCILNAKYIKNKLVLMALVMLMLMLNSLIITASPKGESTNSSTLQPITVTGTVTDESNLPLPGVYVVVQGTNQGTMTDAQGKYSLQVPGSDAKLVFSFIGFLSETVDVAGQALINVTLAQDIKAFEEVVVIGYGTISKQNVTGSVASMKGDVVRDIPTGNITYALQGRLAGVDMSQMSSRPGANMQIRIRGTRSLNASNDPLVVLDGIPFMGALSDIDPNSIKSIDILKDASATAVYGSRGANGVILVTTTKGSFSQKPSVSYNGYYGMKNIFAKYPMMDGPTFVAFREEALANTSPWTVNSADEDNSINTDWQDEVLQKGMVNSHDLAVIGGGENNSYSFGTGYYKETTVVPGQEFSRLSIRGSIDQQIGRFKFGLNTQNSYGTIEGESNNPMSNILSLTPITNPYNADRSIKHILNVGGNNYFNPLEIEDYGNKWTQERKAFATYNALYGEVKIFEGLKYHINLGLNYRKSDYGNYIGKGIVYNTETGDSQATIESELTTNWAVEHLLYYDKILNEKHAINAVAMYSAEQTTYNKSNVSAVGIPADFLQYYNLGQATGSKNINAANQDYWQRGLMSAMGRVVYTYDNKYMLTATVRADGSSVLAKGKKWHTYPAISAGWNIANESFMKNISALDQLKLRVGYGETSNQAIDPYATLGLLDIKYYNYGPAGGAANQYGYYVRELPNENLGWEYSQTWNFGIDFGIMNRISGSVEYYISKTNDLLLEQQLPYTSGVDGVFLSNVGETQNKGLEIALNANIIKSPNGFTWDFGLNVYANRNKITKLSSGETKSEANGWFVGEPIDVIFDYKKIGIWQTDDPMGNVADYEGATGQTGMIKVEYTGEYDENGRPTRVIGTADRQVLGKIDPDFQGGFNTRVGFKNLDLTIVGIFKSGGTLVSSIHAPSSYLNMNSGRRNNVDVDYWTPTNPTNKYPGPYKGMSGDNPKYGSTLAYFDAGYLKFRTISLGYNFSSKLLEKASIRKARIYATVQNPFVLFSPYTKETGLDPETNSPARDTQNQAAAANSTQPTRQLTVAYNTPATRNYLIGLSLTF
jgi:TonB-linked SusC/RagA family outer membrane protein